MLLLKKLQQGAIVGEMRYIKRYGRGNFLLEKSLAL